ncbi:hypothetical protein [Erwinia pyrifoliae]|uniref:Flagella biosynthesis regulator n=1 Tax=Erwinia pyrifoliae TaxID=79967 RepID=A0ABY5X429_ERWPY|nr:hypothetical protein [Erwinia pyrifoliae]MCU8586762.1 hypothetical protein [Erwinia pyrifoliae]UWS32137.1 hypothetical protein NYP84_10690 [Erwinia pyrifoliae]UXK13652.1 hypothetical protein NYP80_07575 [Erwinia pyrifoliae]
MTVHTSGEKNRSAGRDFTENSVQVEQLIGRDVVNIALPDAHKIESRPLVPAQRKQLNQLVKEIAETSDEECFIIWQRVHAEVSVKSIEEITTDQYPNALNYLQLTLDRLRDGTNCKSLIHQLLKKTPENPERQRLYEYCDISFGTRHLSELAKSQLQQALGWLCNEQTERAKSTPPPPSRLSWQELISAYPLPVGAVFVGGLALGAYLF